LNFRDLLKAWLPVLLWMTLMFIGSTDLMSSEHTSRFLAPFLRWFYPEIRPITIAEIHLALRKAAHVTEYAILTGLLFRALRSLIDGFWPRAAVAFLPAMFFAATDEFHQRFVTSRTGSIYDVLVDYSGAFLGIFICRAIHLALLRREKSG
jgi:VanZ family protein